MSHCTCGRPDPRDVMARLRARTKLISSLADEGLTTAQVADVVAGVRPVADVLAERDRTTPTEQENQS